MTGLKEFFMNRNPKNETEWNLASIAYIKELETYVREKYPLSKGGGVLREVLKFLKEPKAVEEALNSEAGEE